jgi:biopolymer transport protein ExbB
MMEVDMDVGMILQQGGPVLWIIIFSGLFALAVFIERGLHLHRARIRSDDFLTGILNILKRRNIKEALTICEETPGPVAYIVKTAILHRDDQREAVMQAVDEASSAEISRMERRLVVVATVAQMTPLLGLLGTIIGMMKFLFVLKTQAPMVQSADVWTALMGALVTTAAGLMVAIPCYAAFNLLVIKIDRIVLDMHRSGSEIIAFLKEVNVTSA